MAEVLLNDTRGRLLKYLEYKGISQKYFIKRIGASTCYIHNMKNSIGAEKQAIIKREFPDLNIGWLLSGEGEMVNGYTNTISMGDNNQTGDISQGGAQKSADNDLYKEIIKLKDVVATLRSKIFKASICPTKEETQQILNEILLDE